MPTDRLAAERRLIAKQLADLSLLDDSLARWCIDRLLGRTVRPAPVYCGPVRAVT